MKIGEGLSVQFLINITVFSIIYNDFCSVVLKKSQKRSSSVNIRTRNHYLFPQTTLNKMHKPVRRSGLTLCQSARSLMMAINRLNDSSGLPVSGRRIAATDFQPDIRSL